MALFLMQKMPCHQDRAGGVSNERSFLDYYFNYK